MIKKNERSNKKYRYSLIWRGILLSYFVIRVIMLGLAGFYHYVFFYKENLSSSFFYFDLLFLLLFFIHLYFSSNKTHSLKLVVLFGLIISMSGYLVLFLFYSVAHDGVEVELPSSKEQNHYLIRVGDLPGLHPDEEMLNREIYIYEKKIPFVYKRIYKDNKPIEQYTAYLKGNMQFIKDKDISLLKIGDQKITVNRKEEG
jgi:hypothetical protein